MTRKRSTYRPRRESPSMLVNRGILNTGSELKERMAVEAFVTGLAEPYHFDYLADMRDCLMLAASHKSDKDALAMCQAVLVVLDNVRIRYQQTKRFGCTGDELHVLRLFCEIYRDFWMRQPVSLYESAYDSLTTLRAAGKMVVNVETHRG